MKRKYEQFLRAFDQWAVSDQTDPKAYHRLIAARNLLKDPKTTARYALESLGDAVLVVEIRSDDPDSPSAVALGAVVDMLLRDVEVTEREAREREALDAKLDAAWCRTEAAIRRLEDLQKVRG